jgi:muconolactone D-isomerase
MEFLVRQHNMAPLGEDLSALKLREREYAMRLRTEGFLIKLWRVPGTTDAIGLWEASDATELHELLAALPMFRWLQISVEALAEHPQEKILRES